MVATFVVGSHCRLHLDVRLEGCCRSSFFVDSSRRVQLCLLSLSSRCTAGLPADLDAVRVLAGSGGACCSLWAVVRLRLGLLHIRPQSSCKIVRGVADSVIS